MPDRILRNEFQQAGIPEIVSTFEKNALADEARILPEEKRQARNVASVDQIDCVTEDGVFDSLVVRERQVVARTGLFNVMLEAGPARKSVFACDGKLRIA